MKLKIIRLKTCSSTNDVAKEMVRSGASEGTVVVSDEQTAGRGTKGRSWHSARGKGLYVSIALRPKSPEVALLSLSAGLAVREAVEQIYRLPLRLRWPNDIVWEGKKLAGILCESGFLGNRPDYVILGIGLNVNHEKSDFPEEIQELAVSVRMAIKKRADGECLLRHVLAGLERWSGIFSHPGGEEEIVRAFERHSLFRTGDPLTVMIGREQVHGRYERLDSGGALLLRDKNGIRRVASAEIIGIL